MKPSGRLLAELARTGRITPELHRRYTTGRRYPVADEHTDVSSPERQGVS